MLMGPTQRQQREGVCLCHKSKQPYIFHLQQTPINQSNKPSIINYCAKKKKNPSHVLTFYCEHFRHLVFLYVSGDKIFFFFFEEMV